MIDGTIAYHAMKSRDPRFDGVFFVGVTSTGIYCRPICPVKTPMKKNCRFFAHAEAAEKASFRPCLRCRPELAPGNAPVDNAHRIAHLMVNRVEEGLIEDGVGLEEIAAQFEISSRQLRRIVQQELGVSPNRVDADTPVVAREAIVDRDPIARDRDRVCQRIFQPAPLQRRL